MSCRDRILEHLRAIAPRGATNRELADALGDAPYYTVYDATRALAERGLIYGEREGHPWVYRADTDASADATPAFEPLSHYDWAVNTNPRSHHAAWLVPVLESADGRAWLAERLRSTITPQEARDATVYHFCRPLRDLLWADIALCGDDGGSRDALIGYYNRVLGLPEDFGVRDIWRRRRSGALRPPVETQGRGWSDGLLNRRGPQRRLRRRAGAARAIVRMEVDALVLGETQLLVLHSRARAPLNRALLNRLRSLATALERRLQRTAHLAAVIGRTEDLGAVNVPYVRWDELARWLDGTPSATDAATADGDGLHQKGGDHAG